MNFEEVVKHHNRLIHKIAHKYSIKNYNHDDLYSEGLTKLFEVFNNYNHKQKWSTYITIILNNHYKNLIRYNTTQSRVNYINNEIRSDIKNYNFDNILNELEEEYSNEELDVIDIAYKLLDKEKNKNIILRVLDNETYVLIANDLNVSKQYIQQIFKNYIDKCKLKVYNNNERRY
jgi:RNA polymerase sigma factor (sigma-70 family)